MARRFLTTLVHIFRTFSPLSPWSQHPSNPCNTVWKVGVWISTCSGSMSCSKTGMFIALLLLASTFHKSHNAPACSFVKLIKYICIYKYTYIYISIMLTTIFLLKSDKLFHLYLHEIVWVQDSPAMLSLWGLPTQWTCFIWWSYSESWS